MEASKFLVKGFWTSSAKYVRKQKTCYCKNYANSTQLYIDVKIIISHFV